jgi:hypothetical protein
MQYSVFCSKDRGSSWLCGFEINVSHISCTQEGQYYHLEFLHPPGDIVRIATLCFIGTCVKLTVIAYIYPCNFIKFGPFNGFYVS